MTEQELERIIDKTVKSTLIKVGFDLSDPIACQEDMHFLRSARHITGAAGTRAVIVLVGVATLAAAAGMIIVVGKAISKAFTS